MVPGAVYVEMALAAATEVYGSNHSVDDLVLHRAVILDETCDPILRTTLNEDDGTLEFAAFTATADGDFKWTVTATAELNTLPMRRARTTAAGGASGPPRSAATTSTPAPRHRGSTTVTRSDPSRDRRRGRLGGRGLAVPERDRRRTRRLPIPSGAHRRCLPNALRHHVLGSGGAEDPYLPTRIRHCAVYGPPEEHMKVHVRVVSATREEIESDITITDASARPLAVFDGFTVQSLSASSRMSPERIDKGLFEIQWIAAGRRA